MIIINFKPLFYVKKLQVIIEEIDFAFFETFIILEYKFDI
jgi:hypothetical protein